MCTRYRRKQGNYVTAVQLSLDTDGFSYVKWGAVQRCKKGDWLVNNGGDVYTVDADVFRRTYRETHPGIFVKITPVWAKQAAQAGWIATKEGRSRYGSGDYIVANNEDGTDAYCIGREKFERLYEPDD